MAGVRSAARAAAGGVAAGRFVVGMAAALALLGPGHAAAQSAGEWRGPEQLWGALCGYCHGAGVSLQLLGAKLPAATIAEFTRKGLKAMPPFAPTQISDAELAALAAWISRSEAPPLAGGGAR
ncbi:MAG: cytochrome c [Gammaproteobacteria bacterium]|nr:cytochrome c [Gammaproteobacteria bacterium]